MTNKKGPMTNEKGPTTNTYFGWVCYINWWGSIRWPSDIGRLVVRPFYGKSTGQYFFSKRTPAVWIAILHGCATGPQFVSGAL